ncbi:MAG TPA: transcription termination factor NusA [Candidatus Gallimonas intestinigallinarum]|uniref:Transcription termination/antitermination protein NusA n=1 Tax=Candidatus Gallimonas intestinigallinarum TaxID=2838604 RepID=A0A9D2DVX2_9FIRM|nr:transcription termination factor NusA [Candidatus Gallimonas intestinigallinarum]
MNKDFFAALADLEREKGISEETFLEALETALVSAYKKQYVGEAGKVEVKLDPEKGTIRCFLTRTVSDAEELGEGEISLEEAQEIKKNAKVGDVFRDEFAPKDFSRIAAQTAKQVILQKIHETERDHTLSEFSDKEGELMSGLIRKVDARNVYIELGKGQIEGLMLPQDQVPGERYNVGDKIKVYVKRIKSGGRNAQVLVTRAAPGLVKRLFEEEVPEIKAGTVIVKGISREPGHRTKMAIMSEDERVDAVGACVGNKGARVNAVVAELNGEKIDIIPWSENPLEFIAKALSPATVLSVTQMGEKSAVAVVPDDKLSLAIGRDGQNARLAARLTGWKIDVKSESAAAKMYLEAPAEASEE